jgi:hypothetical protein
MLHSFFSLLFSRNRNAPLASKKEDVKSPSPDTDSRVSEKSFMAMSDRLKA